MTSLPDYNKITFDYFPPVPLADLVPEASPEALDLISQFLVYNSAKRLPASQVRSSTTFMLQMFVIILTASLYF